MPPKKRRIKKRKNSRHIILVLFLVIVGIFFFFEESGKAPATAKLPKVAIVMDDLGPNKKIAKTILLLDAPLTLAILPHETYSKWIANEGSRLRHQIIAHIPMEAITPQKMGKGALRRSMSSHKIARTLAKSIDSIPNISGISSHMGSAFTKDRRAMLAVITELKKHRLFFLDSFTTHKSIGYKLAKEEGLTAMRRDVFLDNKDDLGEIEIQWKRLIKIAREKGYAIALAHPRKKTLEFLQIALANNREVTIVPISELIRD